jgi:D-serine deaminase-like pyridoxal phosphate-dependent protein
VPALRAVDAMVCETVSLWQTHGLAAPIVSGGSTPTAFQSHHITHLTEIRPGTYIFNDMNSVAGGFCGLDDCAARIVCTVVSDAVPGQVVIDAGSKTLSSDRRHDDPDAGFGHIVEFPDAKITRLSEEHGQVDVRRCDRAPKVAQRVTVIPNHICPCINLQSQVFWQEPDRPLLPIPVEARGCVV